MRIDAADWIAELGDTIELIVWKHYELQGEQHDAQIGRVLRHPANQGIVHLPPVLPMGTVVHCPELVIEDRPTVRRRAIEVYD